MKASAIRQAFLDFFEEKGHQIVPSAPLVNKGDPSLMFINAGMNQFKDYFLGNQTPANPRISDTQKCLRVSGKHNDLEEVGLDSYHHTMFEMLGNWSFGDYFKKEAISWAWELLTEVYGLEKDRLYVSIFEGDESEGLKADEEAKKIWLEFVPEDRILYFDKKDNFWEMGETGPCGPCSEIHIDLRSEEERAKTPGAKLVNMDDPLVIEVWNLVFIEFNRKADKSLENLPAKHIDTGMGLERICMAIQKKQSNYDTDLFTPFIQAIEKESGIKYTFQYPKSIHETQHTEQMSIDIAMRVVVDHLRAVAFTIADGQLPANTGAGYVIRRILRRAVRYYYSFLGINKPLLYSLVPLLSENFGDIFPEIRAQQDSVARIIKGEEKSFLRTLEVGISRFESLEATNKVISGSDAFELFDTFGFPIDLTRLMAGEKNWSVDEPGFEKALAEQKARSRADAQKSVGDWKAVNKGEVNFVGYDHTQIDNAKVLKYRTVELKGKPQYQIVLDQTPFYAESGGQRGDRGFLEAGGIKYFVLDSQKENDLIIHIVDKFPEDLTQTFVAAVDEKRRQATSQNHSAAHLLHAGLHEILGTHAVQKGQDLDFKRIRFDFSHFEKVSKEQLVALEQLVNAKIRANIPLEEERAMPIEDAKQSGAVMLFGEKYGETVRVITFDGEFSKELCGGTHVQATGEIGQFKILSESSVASGIRRIEAVTAEVAETFVNKELAELDQVNALLKNPKQTAKQLESVLEENKALKKQIEVLQNAQAGAIKAELKNKFVEKSGVNFLAVRVPITDSKALKSLAYQLEKETGNALIVFGAEVKGKPQLMITVSESLTKEKELHAGNIVKELAKEIKGGGGGQAFFATAGGTDASGLDRAIARAGELV